jgi:hypothetical protein
MAAAVSSSEDSHTLVDKDKDHDEPAAFTTMATIECLDELALFLVSLRTAHPTTPIWVATTRSLLDLLFDHNSAHEHSHHRFLDVVKQFAEPQARSDLKSFSSQQHLSGGGFVSTAHVHWVPLIHDGYLPISRSAMERTPGVFYRSRHADFMMEKSTVLELALAHAQLLLLRGDDDAVVLGCRAAPPLVLFLDCDICTLAPWPRLPRTCAIALSPHGIRSMDEALWGEYNGGVVGVRQAEALFQWRKYTLVSRFHDQSSLEDVADWSRRTYGSESVFQFSRCVNYGYWRMMQTSDELSHKVLTTEVSKFTMVDHKVFPASTGDGGSATAKQVLCYNGQPLQSVHTHVFLPPAQNSSSAMPLFNALLTRWLRSSRTRSYDHIVRLLVR